MKRFATGVAVALLLAGLTPASRVASAATASPPASSLARVYVEPAAGYGFLSAALLSARHRIDLSMYELKDPTLEAHLVARARAGVRVRVLLNSAYYGRRENSAAADVLRRGGVSVTWAPTGQIFHAKYLVIDATRVYIGTGNLVDYYYATTRDVWVLDTNLPDVRAVEATFTHDVAHLATAPVTSGGLIWSPGSLAPLVSFIHAARHTLVLENEEMRQYDVEDALIAAAARGVRVTVVMTASTTYLSALGNLAHHGVRVELLPSSGVYIHAKLLCADCGVGAGALFVGSENFSTSSLDFNRELGVVTRTPAVVATVNATLLADAAAGARLAG